MDKVKKLLIINILMAVAGVFIFLTDVQDSIGAEKTAVKNVPVVSSGDKQLESVIKNGKPTVLHFTAAYCMDCIQVKPVIESLNKTYKDKVNFVIVDIQSNDALAKAAIKKYKVFGVPHTVILNADGVKVKVLSGVHPKEKYKTRIETLVKK